MSGRLDVLVCNAGVWVPMEQNRRNVDNLEIHAGVNHLGHFLLTRLLLERLEVPVSLIEGIDLGITFFRILTHAHKNSLSEFRPACFSDFRVQNTGHQLGSVSFCRIRTAKFFPRICVQTLLDG